MSNHQERIKQIIREYKSGYLTDPEKYSLPIVVGKERVGSVRPVPTELKGEAARDAVLLTDWRNLHKDSFMSPTFGPVFTATEERTFKWLEATYFNDDLNIIFIIEAMDKTPIGHTGLANFDGDLRMAESTRLLRGAYAPIEKQKRINLLELGTNVMLNWAFETLSLEKLYGRIFSDNWLVFRLDTRSGFYPVEKYFVEMEGNKREVVRLEITEAAFRSSPSQQELEN